MTRDFSGIYTPVVTPFDSRGELDERGLAANIDRYMASSLTGIVVLGSNGEAPQLEDDEADRAIAIVRERVPAAPKPGGVAAGEGGPRGRPLLAGVGRESTRATIAAAKRAADLGADAVMARTPSFYKNLMTSETFVRHYTEVADASPVPVLLYNVTMYTGVNLLPDAVEQLSHHPNIAGIKDSGNDMVQLADYIGRSRPGFAVFVGAAPSLFAATTLGAHGAVLALAGLVPDMCVALVNHVKAGRIDEARQLQRRLLPLARSIGPVWGVPGLKAALDLMGLAGGVPRPPLRPVSSTAVDALRKQLSELGVLATSHASR